MGGHGAHLEPTKYRTIHDIPDSMVKTWSHRDPDNKLYQTRRWVNYKKKQILFQQNDGIPNYKRTPMRRFFYYSQWVSVLGCLAYNIYVFRKNYAKK